MRGERFMIDTNIFVYLATDLDSISADVLAMLDDANVTLCMSIESVKELILGYRSKGLCSRRWRTPEAMLRAITQEYFIEVLPLTMADMETYARLETDDARGHKDPSDHVIIAQAITLGLPLISSDTRFPFYRRQGLNLVANRR